MQLAKIQQRFLNQVNMAKFGRMAIYSHAIQANLKKALAITYPVCVKLLGEGCFQAVAELYIKQYQSYYKNLADYGSEFADFIAICQHTKHLEYLSDVAKLEWLIAKVEFGANAKTLNLQALSKVPASEHENLTFAVVSNSYLFQSAYPCDTIWNANQRDDPEIVDLLVGGVKLFIWRQGYDLHLDRLEDAEFMVLSGLKQGQKFGVLCASLLKVASNCNIAEIFPTFMQRGYIEEFN